MMEKNKKDLLLKLKEKVCTLTDEELDKVAAYCNYLKKEEYSKYLVVMRKRSMSLRIKLKNKIMLIGLKMGFKTLNLFGVDMEHKKSVKVPVIQVNQITDYEWQEQCYKDRLENPSKYRALGEDVDAVLEALKYWLDVHKDQQEKNAFPTLTKANKGTLKTPVECNINI